MLKERNVFILFIFTIVFSLCAGQQVKAASTVCHVPADYGTIQEAIDETGPACDR